MKNRFTRSQRTLSAALIVALAVQTAGPVPLVYARTPESALISSTPLPAPGTRITTSRAFRPATLTGLKLHADHPLSMEFLIDTGDDPLTDSELSAVNRRLINYFLAALTVPEDQLWVNLSPEEADRIIAADLVKTEMGRDMLAMDYLLKQLMASLLYPEEGVGSEFWRRVHRQAQARFGTTDIPTDTFNKIWIVPEQAHVHVQGEHVLIIDSALDVMLEEDYLSLAAHTAERAGGTDGWSAETKALIREVLIPEIRREINTGRQFANLRQIYHAMLLATWYKKNLRENILTRMYAGRNLVTGIDLAAPGVKEIIYEQYLAAFRKGAFDYIREDLDPVSGEPVPRRYFSGGLRGYDQAMVAEASADKEFFDELGRRPLVRQSVDLRLIKSPTPADANIAELAQADEGLFRRLAIAHFNYDLYGEPTEGVEFVGTGFSRRTFAVPDQYPHLLFKLARYGPQAEPPSADESGILSALVEKIGYELITVDGIELIKAPGLAPFRYVGSDVIQLRGSPVTDPAHFAELVALFSKLGVHWDLAAAPNPAIQLKNLALYEEEVGGVLRQVPRVTDLKDFANQTADQAITAEGHARLDQMFSDFNRQLPFLWTRIDRLAQTIAVRGLASPSPQRDQELLAKLRLMLRSLMSIRELPVLQDSRPVIAYPDIDTSPEAIFYLTVDDILTGIEGHIVHLQKLLAPTKFGPPPSDMQPLSQGVLLLKRQVAQARQSFLALDRESEYPVLVRPSGYQVFVDMLDRDLNVFAFQAAFLGKIGNLGLTPGTPTVGITNLRRVQQKLTRLLMHVRQKGTLQADLRQQQQTKIDALEEEIITDLVALVEVNDRQQFPANDTNSQFVQSVVAATTREMLLDVFGQVLSPNGMRTARGKEITEDTVLRLIDGVDLIHRRLEELHHRSDYLFVMDESTSLIVAHLDVPLQRLDFAMTAEFDERLKQRFRRLSRTAILHTHNLDKAAQTLRRGLPAGGESISGEDLRALTAQLSIVERIIDWFRGLPELSEVTSGDPRTLSDEAVFQQTLNRRLDRLSAAVTAAQDHMQTETAAGLVEQELLKRLVIRAAGELTRFTGFLSRLSVLPEISLLRGGDHISVFDEYDDHSSFISGLQEALRKKATRYRAPLRLVGSETHELAVLEALIEDLSRLNRDLAFSDGPGEAELRRQFTEKRQQIGAQIGHWTDAMGPHLELAAENQSEFIDRIVVDSVRHFMDRRLRQLVETEIDLASMEERTKHVLALRLQVNILKERLQTLAGSRRHLFIRDPQSNRLRVGMDPADMLDNGMAMRLLFNEYLLESRPAYEALAGHLDALQEIVQKTNHYLTQEQIVELIEKILFYLARARSTSSMLMIAEAMAEEEPTSEAEQVAHNTVLNAIALLEGQAQVIAMNVRNPGDTTVPRRTVDLIQDFNYYYNMFRLMADADHYPLIHTEDGQVVFDEALTYGLEPRDLQRAFQWESLRLGANRIKVSGREATPFGRMEALVDTLQTAVDNWDTDDLLAMFGFGRVFGDVQPELLSVLDEISRHSFTRRPETIRSRDDLVNAIVINSINQIVVERLYGWVQTDTAGFILKEDAERYINYLRQELRLAANRLNTLSRRADYAYKRHHLSGEISLDVSELLPASQTDQAALGMGDRLLDAHFKTVELLGSDVTITFTDTEVDHLMYILESGSGDLIEEPALFAKLIHQINMVYRRENGVNGLTRQWLELLSDQYGLSLRKFKNVFRWFKFVDINTATVDHVSLVNFFQTFMDINRTNPGVYDSFTYYVPPDASDKQKLAMAAGNMLTMTGMFSRDFINGKTVLKAAIPGRDYYVGLEFGVPENGYGLNVVIGENLAESNEPFPNVFMRIGIDTQGPDMRINFMQGVAGKEDIINDEFVRRMGFHPGIALLYIAVDLAHQGHFNISGGELSPVIDPFRTLHGIRPEFIPSLRNRMSRATINIMKGYDDFGLRKKSQFSRFRSVTDLVRVLIPQRMAQRDLRARSISRLHEAFRNLKEIPSGKDQAQLSEPQRTAILEYVSEKVGTADGTYNPNFRDIMEALRIPRHLADEVYQLILSEARQGTFDFAAFYETPAARDEALTAEGTKGGIDLNPANLNLRQTGAPAVTVPDVPLTGVPDIRGLVPVLIQVTPVTNLPLLLGQSQEFPLPQLPADPSPVLLSYPADQRLSFYRQNHAQ